MRPVLIAGVVLAGSVVGGALRPANSQPPERLPELTGAARAPATDSKHPYGTGKAPFAHRPATSCAAAACHGGGQVGKVGSEHSTWAPEAFPVGGGDPHSRAYSVLYDPQSVLIAKNLNIGPAHLAPRCLQCHAIETGGDPATREQVLAEGVGCSGCHGPAEKWVSEHYLDSWKTLSNREKWEKFGFVPTSNIVARTLNCAGCHLGDSQHDLNHDIYGAGHPRISFEAARMHYQPDYRKHWTEKAPQPDFEVRLWIVGQAATLRAAVDLLLDRATRAVADDAKNPTPWPEFSGYSCYACHQQVGDAKIRGIASATPRPAGVPGWEVWSNTAVKIAAEACGEAYPGLPSPDLTAVVKLREMMEQKRFPAAKPIAAQAALARDQLDAWLVAMQNAEDDRSKIKPVSAGLARKLAHQLAENALASDGAKLKDHDWDALTSNYLGCAAMFHATGGSAGNNWLPQLEAVRAGLRFPPPEKGARFNSPALTFDRLDTLRKNFTLLRDATKGGN